MYVQQAQGLGIAYFAKKMLQDKGMSLEGKRCIITGSNATSLALAEKLTELGAVPLTFSDTSGDVLTHTSLLYSNHIDPFLTGRRHNDALFLFVVHYLRVCII